MEEVVYDIPGFSDYQITRMGKVWSKLRKRAHCSGRFLTPLLQQTGYVQVNLYKNGKMYTRRIHRLLLETFVGPCPKGMECRHLDGDKQNNILSNLCWGTRKENGVDRVVHGTSGQGENHPRVKLNNQRVCEIRNLAKSGGASQQLIAKQFGICQQMVSRIKCNGAWNNV